MKVCDRCKLGNSVKTIITICENVLKYGTGAININSGRIVTNENLSGGAYAKSGTDRDDGYRLKRGIGEYKQPVGRWPANTILSHSDLCSGTNCHESCPVKIMDA